MCTMYTILREEQAQVSLPEYKIPLKDSLSRQQLKGNDCGDIHIFINIFPVHEKGPSLPIILTSRISQDSFVLFATMGSVGLSAYALQTNELFSFVPNDFGLYNEILNCPQSNYFAKMLLEHLYKFSNKGGGWFINDGNLHAPRALGKFSTHQSCFIFSDEYK